MARLSASVPCRLDYRHGVALLLEALCVGLVERDVYHIVSAFNEAFSNVVRHSQLQEHEALEVRAERLPDRVSLCIIDDGVPYHPAFPEMGSEPDPLALDEGGMGLVLIRECMDEVSYERSDRNMLSMVKQVAVSKESSWQDLEG